MLEHVRKKMYPAADQVSLKLLEKGKTTPITVTLSEALARFEPFSYLVQTKPGTEETPGTYRFLKFNDPESNRNPKKKGPMSNKYYKRKGRSKETHLLTDCPAALLRHRLKLAYGFLLEGSRMEFHLRSKANARAESVDSALRNHLHLRPDTILAAMPPGTTMLAVPATTQPPDKELERESKFFANKTSDVFWALEYQPALKRLNVVTPGWVKKLGTWTDHQNWIRTTMHGVETLRRARLFRKKPVRFRDLKVRDGDLPINLSDLMPKRPEGKRADDDKSSGPDARPHFIRLLKSGRKTTEVDTR